MGGKRKNKGLRTSAGCLGISRQREFQAIEEQSSLGVTEAAEEGEGKGYSRARPFNLIQ
jgi:hypothetical protein